MDCARKPFFKYMSFKTDNTLWNLIQSEKIKKDLKPRYKPH